LILVEPETVVAWHRAGFRLFWRVRSRSKSLGRPIIDAEVRALIQLMVKENPTWGAPRIHGELLKLGFDVSERTVSRSIRRLSVHGQMRELWTAFLSDHREVITAWTSPCPLSPPGFCIASSSSDMFDASSSISMLRNTGHWIIQLREAFPACCPYRCAILDRDGRFGNEVTDLLAASEVRPKRISPACPGQTESQNAGLETVAEIFRRLVKDYISYDHRDRTHDGLRTRRRHGQLSPSHRGQRS
jgi:hypothetical protein